ncbi:DUF5658 family protein [Natronorubrum daqingense]|uniref:Uncharacterized protein n=1 Tax=Natronorubrum daqingense TaxID=588898 RepID=A0A1N7G1M7_9EURY|nr:DUF5658 family protein [Natronorubrum daqingense]APX98637.1 hypothetical protein BB347_18270 [Natronorubrum daqingense]SIS06513.1 hypothetical protein SAMN05421809_3671 [Natronorubrum daqingense]
MSVRDGSRTRLTWPAIGTDRETPLLETAVARAVIATLAWAFLVLAAFADVFTTVYGLGIGAHETNPVGRMLFFDHGIAAAAAFKLAVIGLVAGASVAIYGLERRYLSGPPVWWLYYPALVATIWMGAAAWNALLLAGVVR